MAGTGPQVARSPLELLNNRTTSEPGVLTKHVIPIVGGVFGFATAVGGNWISKRPIASGIHRHVIATVLGVTLGKVFNDNRDNHLAERDAIFRHYIELHPDDFPPYERRQFKDVFEPWVPIR